MTYNGTSWASPSNMLAYLTYRMYDQQEVLVWSTACSAYMQNTRLSATCMVCRNSWSLTSSSNLHQPQSLVTLANPTALSHLQQCSMPHWPLAGCSANQTRPLSSSNWPSPSRFDDVPVIALLTHCSQHAVFIPRHLIFCRRLWSCLGRPRRCGLRLLCPLMPHPMRSALM
jgi:hypothetical protein